MADPVDPLRRRPPTSPDLRGVHRSNATVERRRRRERDADETRRRREREEDEVRRRRDAEEAADTDEDSETGTHVDLRV